MRIQHIMADGSTRESVKGVKIPKQTYKKIMQIRSKKNENQIKAEGSKSSHR